VKKTKNIMGRVWRISTATIIMGWLKSRNKSKFMDVKNNKSWYISEIV
jgi:hypothetical protein